MLRRLSALALAIVLFAACNGDQSEPVVDAGPGVGAESPMAAVEELVAALDAGEFEQASRLAIPDQAALAALSEGAAAAEVADALRNENHMVTSNFWAGFAQGTGGFLTEGVTVAEREVVERDGDQFHVVDVTSPDGTKRPMVLRDSDGYRVDLFASFGGGLADKMAGPTERLLSGQNDDAQLIIGRLRELVPSLFIAASLPETPTAVAQQLTSLIEIITRVS